MATVGLTRNELIIKSEELLMRLQKENRKQRRVYKVKDPDKIKTLAKLNLAYDLMNERIANDGMLLALEESTMLGLTLQERQDRTALKKDINDLGNLAKMFRETARLIVQDLADEAADPLGKYDEKTEHIAAAMKLLDESEYAPLNDIEIKDEVLV